MRELRRSLLRHRLDLIVLQRLARGENQPDLLDAVAEVQGRIDRLQEKLSQLQT